MKTKINYKALIPYFICTMTYSFTAIMNIEVIEQILVLEKASYDVLDKIYYYNILGYVMAGILLLILSSYFSFRKIVIFNLLIYILSIYSIGFSDFSENSAVICSMIYSATTVIIVTILLCYIFNGKKINKKHALSFFFSSVSGAYLMAELILSSEVYQPEAVDLASIRDLVKINITSIIIFLFIFILNSGFGSSSKTKTANSFVILKNIELELISVFTIFYIIMAVFYNYEIYIFTDSLLMISVSNVKYYIFITIFFVSIFAPKFIYTYNMYKINIICIASLLFMFLSMPFWTMNILFDSICWFIIGSIMYILFGSNLLILVEKFESFNLQLAIILYIFAASIGYYCGYITANISEDDFNEYSLLTSICFVLFSLLIYYLYLYKKNNLKEW